MWFEAASITCKVEIVKAPVLPVPDYALTKKLLLSNFIKVLNSLKNSSNFLKYW